MLREPLHHFQLPSFPLDTNEKKKTLSLSLCLSLSRSKSFLQNHVHLLLLSLASFTCPVFASL